MSAYDDLKKIKEMMQKDLEGLLNQKFSRDLRSQVSSVMTNTIMRAHDLGLIAPTTAPMFDIKRSESNPHCIDIIPLNDEAREFIDILNEQNKPLECVTITGTVEI